MTSGGIRKKYPVPLTDAKIRHLKPAARPIRRWDGGGLYLEVSLPAENCGLKYRFNGKEKLLALGKWDAVTSAKRASFDRMEEKILAKGMDAGTVRKRPSWKLSIGQ